MKLHLHQLSARHPAARTGAAPALRGLDLHVAAGEAVAVIGPSGAGKTTLLQVLACALPPGAQGDAGPPQVALTPSGGGLGAARPRGHFQGDAGPPQVGLTPSGGGLGAARPRGCTSQFELDGIDPWRLPTRALQRLRGQLFLAPQVPPLPPRQRVVTAVLAGRLPSMGLWASLRSLWRPGDLPAAFDALARFDLGDKLFERVDRLSGGERQRVGLARALLAPARLWLVDEPLSSLDPTRAQQALAALIGVAHERGITLVTSLHQVDVALAQFPRIVGLRDGQIAFDLPAAEVTPQRLAQLYAQHAHELPQAPSALVGDAPGPVPDSTSGPVPDSTSGLLPDSTPDLAPDAAPAVAPAILHWR